MDMIKRVKLREEKIYKPRVCPKTGKTIEGSVIESDETWEKPENYIDEIVEYTKQNQTPLRF